MNPNDDASSNAGPVIAEIVRRRSQRGKTVETKRSDVSIPAGADPMKDDTPRTQTFPLATPFQSLVPWVIVVIAAFLTALYILLYSNGTWDNPPIFHHESHNGVVESLDLPSLRPEEHLTRAPTTIHLEWHVSKGERSPDGVKKEVYLINDEFVGPTIEAMSGDTIHLDLFNQLSDGEGLAIHFHGLEMRGYNAMDGAVGITQDPVPAGGNMTYHFKISENQSGTFWYHSHSQVQRGDGLFGALIIHDPRDTETEDVEERVVMINDWYHRSSRDALAWYMRSGSFGMEPVPDSILVNGRGAYNCSKAVPARPVKCTNELDGHSGTPQMSFDAGKTYRLRFINTGMLAGVSISINGTSMRVLEIDGGHRVRREEATSIGILYPGQRVDVLVNWSEAGSDEITISLDRDAFRYPNPALTATQSFPIPIGGEPRSEVSAVIGPQRLDLLNLSPLTLPDIPEVADQTILLYTTTLKLARLANVPHGFINQTTWEAQSPPLISIPRSQYNSHQLIPFVPYTADSEAIWVDIFLNNLDEDDHPFHMHGYAPWVLQTHSEGWGLGSWNPYRKEVPPGGELDLTKAVRRDTFIVPRRGYVVLRFRADNAGIWMFHCHVLWHLGSGMGMGIEVGHPHSLRI